MNGTRSREKNDVRPAWRLDLRTVGWVEPSSSSPIGFFSTLAGISFPNESQVLMYFVLHQTSVSLSVRDAPKPTDPFQLIAVLADSNTGRVIMQQAWPTTGNSTSMIKPLESGGYVVVAHDKVMFLDASFQVLHASNLLIFGGTPLEGYSVYPARDGPLVVLQHAYQNTVASQAIDTNTFQVVDRWDEDHLSSVAVSESVIVETNEQSRLLRVRKIGGTSFTIDLAALQGLSSPAFLSDRVIAVRSGNGLACVDLLGRGLWKFDYAVKERLHILATSQNGQYIGAYLTDIRASFFDTFHSKSKVLIYDANSQKISCAIRFLHEPKHHFAFALSPNGRQLGESKGKVMLGLVQKSNSARNLL